MLGRDYETELRIETTKWGDRLARALKGATAAGPEGEAFLENIRAYQDDAEHFVSESDLVRAFECVVWAWAWLEIGARESRLDVPALRDL